MYGTITVYKGGKPLVLDLFTGRIIEPETFGVVCNFTPAIEIALASLQTAIDNLYL